MKYQPSLPEHNDNVTHQRPGREFLILIAGVSVIAAVAFWLLGWAVDAGVDYLSPEMEARITRAFAFKTETKDSPAPAKQAALQGLLDELHACADLPYPVTLQLAETKQPNAVALPGGRIVVFAGLLGKVKSRNGLAFVLAHELAHFKNRDHLRGIGRSVVLVGITAFLTGAHSDLTQIVTPVSHGGMAQYSQTRETAADNRALQILACRYGHVGGATEFFEAMLKEDEGYRFSHYFDSHPETRSRIENLRREAARMGLTFGAPQALAM